MCFLLFLALLSLISTAMATNQNPAAPENLNVTAISTKDGVSTLECWQLAAPFVVSSQTGVVGAAFSQLGKTENLSYGIVPAKYNGGWHNAPQIQWVAFLSGEAVISVPGSKETATIKGGRHGLIFVADIAGLSKQGHLTQYPSNQQTTVLQIPTKDGGIPPHKVLYQGPCRTPEVDDQSVSQSSAVND